MTEKKKDTDLEQPLRGSSQSTGGNSASGTSRRAFLKLGVAGAGVAAAGAAGVTVARRMEGIPQDTLPIPINDDFKPIDQRFDYDPFAMMFSLQGIGVQWYILPIAIIGAFFMTNFWCRFFCPTGHALTSVLQLRKKIVSVFKQKITE